MKDNLVIYRTHRTHDTCQDNWSTVDDAPTMHLLITEKEGETVITTPFTTKYYMHIYSINILLRFILITVLIRGL